LNFFLGQIFLTNSWKNIWQPSKLTHLGVVGVLEGAESSDAFKNFIWTLQNSDLRKKRNPTFIGLSPVDYCSPFFLYIRGERNAKQYSQNYICCYACKFNEVRDYPFVSSGRLSSLEHLTCSTTSWTWTINKSTYLALLSIFYVWNYFICNFFL